MGSVCPGLPSPSGVHLVTHPLHRAQYMTDWRIAREREGERKREREKERERKRRGEVGETQAVLHAHRVFHSMALV